MFHKGNTIAIQQVIILLAVFLLSQSVFSQKVNLKGQVTDTLLKPIENSTIYSTPLGHDEGLLFSITDDQGNFKLKLSGNKPYVITISHLGYYEIKDTVTLQKDMIKDYVLKESSETLDEIILRKKLAVSVKEDTINYRTDQFTNGQERKLRDVLKKLPGLDVDREGNVTVNGKDVTKLMVDGKDFFNGDEKLGVNNIPADAVDEVVALDNYTAIPWLKGLTDSDQLALNIKLKEGKKNFLFGDIQAGAGFKERYKTNPTLFYYSPKTAVNFIGDLDNTGNRSFTSQDYLSFEVGDATLSNYSDAISRALQDPLVNALSTTDFRYLKNVFGALNINHDFKSGLNLTLYSLNNDSDQENLSNQRIDYLTQNNISENRTTSQDQDQFFTANTLKLQRTTSRDLDILARLDLKNYDSEYEQFINSETQQSNQFNDRFEAARDFSINSSLNLNKRFSSKHISTLETGLRFEDRENDIQSIFDNSLFPAQVPLMQQDSGIFNVFQTSSRTNARLNFDFKHYYVISSNTHLYPFAGADFSYVNFRNRDFQLEDDEGVNDFFESGFNNDLETSINDYYLGAQLKKKIGKTIIKPGLVARFYDWNASNFEQQIVDTNRLVLLPELLVEYEPLNTRKFRFNYAIKSQFANPLDFANRLRINSFNQILIGNEEVRNSLYHNLSLGYSSFKLLKGTTFFASLNYRRFIEGVRNATEIDGIEQTNITIFTDLPENSYSGRLNYSTYLGEYKVSYRGFASLNNYSRIINDVVLSYQSYLLNNEIGLESRFKGAFNFELEGSYSFNDLSSDNLENRFENWTANGSTELRFFKHFTWRTNVEYTYFKNQSSGETNDFLIANSSLEYWKESTAWTFKIQLTNAFDTDIKFSNSFNQFQSIENRRFVQPRILLFAVIYNL